MSEKRKVIITCAVTGSIHTPTMSPHLPITPREIADAAVGAAEAGAAIVHLHARHPDNSKTDVEAIGEAIEIIHDKCPIITEVGTGCRDRFGKIRNSEERLALLDITPKPDRETINAGTFTFQVFGGKTPPKGETGRAWTFNNPPELMNAFATGMKERGIDMEFEAYDVGHIHNIRRMVDWGVLDKDEIIHINFVTGIGGGIDPSAKAVVFMVDNLPPNSSWAVMSIGSHQYPIITLGLIMGGNIRVGMEDNIYLSRGVLAKSNGELVAKAVRIAGEVGREIATVEEAREMLSI